MTTRGLYDYKAAAEWLSVSTDVVQKLYRQGDLPAVIAPGTKSAIRFRHEDLESLRAAARPTSPKQVA